MEGIKLTRTLLSFHNGNKIFVHNRYVYTNFKYSMKRTYTIDNDIKSFIIEY